MITLLAFAFASCEQKFTRPSEELLIFDTVEYPQLSAYVNAGQDVAGTNVLLLYKNGLGRIVDVEILNTIGYYSDKMTVTLEEGEGTITVPLKGSCSNAGIQEVKVRIQYDMFNIFCPLKIGVRPETIEPLALVGNPVMTGEMLQGLPNDACKVQINYENAWSRKMSIRFESEDEGFNKEPMTYKLNLDNLKGHVDITVPATPASEGEVAFSMFVALEGDDMQMNKETKFDFKTKVNLPIEYVEEEVSHEIIITDRNILIEDATKLEKHTFTYKTVFVDMNGDGYVSGNHEIWLDKNVGATSTDITSPDSYGLFYQGARNAPGYISGSHMRPDVIAGKPNYYIGEDWSMDNARWFVYPNKTPIVLKKINDEGKINEAESLTIETGKIGPSNPCPKGFRMPTTGELKLLIKFLGSKPAEYGNSVLKLPLPGAYIPPVNGKLNGQGTEGYYWGLPVHNGNIPTLEITSTVVDKNRPRGCAMPIRCVKAKESEIAEY